jgi:hypothetical protein
VSANEQSWGVFLSRLNSVWIFKVR